MLQDRFIYYDIANPQPALDRVRELERDRELYLKMKALPILRDGEDTLRKFFSWSEDVGGGELRDKVLAMLRVTAGD